MNCSSCNEHLEMMIEDIYFRASPFSEATDAEMGVTAFRCTKCDRIYLYPNDEIIIKFKEEP